MKPLRIPANLARDSDVALSVNLLCGVFIENGKGGAVTYLSRHTKPTENEARAALARVLLSKEVPPIVLAALAGAFAPKDMQTKNPILRSLDARRAVLQNQNQGHRNDLRHFNIAYEVDARRRDGASYNGAAASVAEEYGLSERQVKRISQEVRLGFDSPPRKRKVTSVR
jgi:plasmid stability protein